MIAAIAYSDMSSEYYPGGIIIAGKNISPVLGRYSDEQTAMAEAERDGKARSYKLDTVPEVSVYISTAISSDETTTRLSAATSIASQARDTYIQERRWNTLKHLGMVAFIPPVLVFLMGASMFWAISGFSRDT